MTAKHGTAAKLSIDSSLKRIAWAYGCAPKGTAEERAIGELLVAKVRVNPQWASPAQPALHPCFLGGRVCGDDPCGRCRDCPFGGLERRDG